MSDETQTGEEIEAALDDATEAVEVEAARLDELAATGGDGDPIGFAHLMDVPVRVTVEVGRKRLTLAELADLRPGALVVLDREAHEPADILVNGKVVARGEVVLVDGSYGVRVSDVVRGNAEA